MKERANKIKNWFKEREEDIKIGGMFVGTGILCSVAGYFIGSKLTELSVAMVLQRFHDKGLMKLIDPRSGVEIGINEFSQVAKEVLD